MDMTKLSDELDRLREAQALQAQACIGELVSACRKRYLQAAYLLEVRSRDIELLEDFQPELHLKPEVLRGPYIVIAKRYLEMRSGDLESGAQDDVLDWTAYFRLVLIPSLLVYDKDVRQVLWLAGALPCEAWERSEPALCESWSMIELPIAAMHYDPALRRRAATPTARSMHPAGPAASRPFE